MHYIINQGESIAQFDKSAAFGILRSAVQISSRRPELCMNEVVRVF
jgi:hypothetical protein